MLKENIWIEKLGTIEIIVHLIKSFFYRITVYYNRNVISPFSKYFLNLLKEHKLCSNFFSIDFSLEKKERYGETLVYQNNRNFNACFEQICNKYIFGELECFKNMAKCYLASFLFDRIAFATMVEFQINSIKEQIAEKNVFYFKRHSLNKIIKPFYQRKGFIMKESLNFVDTGKWLARPFILIILFLLGKILPRKVKSNLSKIRPSIWVEYLPKDVVDLIFWRKNIDIKQFDIVYYIDRKDTPLTKEVIREIEEDGLKWVDLHIISSIRIKGWKILELKKNIFKLFVQVSSRPFWLRIIEFEYNLWFLFYQSIFKQFNVKVLIQHQDLSWKQEVQAKAVESNDGIMVGFHWSNYPCQITPWCLFPAHIFFVWSKLFYELVKNNPNTCKYILPSGVWINNNNQRVKNINSQLKDLTFIPTHNTPSVRVEMGCNHLPKVDGQDSDLPRQVGERKDTAPILSEQSFIISVFDSSVAYNIYQSPNTLSQFYIRLLQLLIRNHSWRIIVKSKNWDDIEDFYFLPRGEEIVNEFKLLIRDKRMLLLEHTVSPITAAVRANLSVCYGLNSAGIIVGVHGYRVIHWDCSGWLKHPFYRDQQQEFIFQTLDEIEEAILKVSQGNTTIGDFSKWKQQFNYFNDFKAHQRIGEFLQNFMEKVVMKKDMKCLVETTVKEYIEKNKIGEDFFKLDSWWGEE